MLLYVATRGKGTRESPLEVDLPTYEIIAWSDDRKLAAVEVPDNHLPDWMVSRAAKEESRIDGRRILNGATQVEEMMFHAYLDSHYKATKRQFRPRIAAPWLDSLDLPSSEKASTDALTSARS